MLTRHNCLSQRHQVKVWVSSCLHVQLLSLENKSKSINKSNLKILPKLTESNVISKEQQA